ncbi:MAG: aminoglycoside phosphotransferase family protein [Chloroflexota bacterium]
MNLPPAFVDNILLAFGEDGRRWLVDLPGLIDQAAHRWDIEPGEPVGNLSYNYVAPARRGNGTECILKIGVPNRELTSEVASLQLYAGDGACQIYEADPEAGMFLLERLQPGTLLCAHGDDETQTAIAAGVMKRLWKPAPAGEPFIALRGWFDELVHLRPRFDGGTGPFPTRLVETAEGLLKDLFADEITPIVLRGDCHHYNILISGRGWLAIDPKGVIGPAEYEPAPLLLNPWDDFIRFPDAARVTARRIAILSDLLGFDRKRIHAWAVAHSVLSAWWDLTPAGTGGEYALACGEIFLSVRV